MSAAGKKNTLAMKDPAKPWPFRPPTRAGQDATASRMTADTTHRRASRSLPAFPQNAHACCRTAAPAPGTRSRAATTVRLATENFHGCLQQTPPGRGEQGTLVPTSGGAWLPRSWTGICSRLPAAIPVPLEAPPARRPGYRSGLRGPLTRPEGPAGRDGEPARPAQQCRHGSAVPHPWRQPHCQGLPPLTETGSTAYAGPASTSSPLQGGEGDPVNASPAKLVIARFA